MSGRLADRALTRLVNPVVRALARSPAHDVLGGVALLTYTGRRSGRTLTVPANALPVGDAGDAIAVLTRRRRGWWRNFRGGAPVTVRLAGRDRAGRAVVDRDVAREEVAALVSRAYARAGHPIPDARAAEMAHDRVVVRVALEPAEPVEPALRGAALWRRWTACATVGETVAFALPAVAGALLTAASAPWFATVPVTLGAGAAEGAILGFAQALAVRTAVPAVATREWIRATVTAALVAWAVALVPIVGDDAVGDLPAAVQALMLAVLGAVLLFAMGAFQWRVLRPHVTGASMWVPATAGAWFVALAVFFAISAPLWHPGQPVGAVIAVGLLAGLAMAVTAAALTGAALVRLVGGSSRVGSAGHAIEPASGR